jgi:two-component system nitrate/nitrite response regulator NarL
MPQAPKPTELVTIFVRDSHRIGTQLLSRVLSRERRFRVLRHESGPARLESVRGADLVLVSASLEGDPLKGCEFARQVRSAYPGTKVVILADAPDRKLLLEALRAGARGVFSRNDPLELLGKCIWSVHKGQVWANRAELSQLLEALDEPAPMRLVDAKGAVLLSNREHDVVRWVVEGLTNREIASRLKLSEHTIKNYLFRIFDKLGISSRAELIIYALSHLKRVATPQPELSLHDDSTRVRWCHKAAEQCSVAPYTLGEMYRDGRGVTRDQVSALMWFMVAEAVSTDVHDKSKAAQQNLKSAMASKEVNEARRRAAEWVKIKHTGPASEAARSRPGSSTSSTDANRTAA